MTERKRDGSRVIELLIPITIAGRGPVESITLKPVKLDHVLRWQDGMIAGPMALMAELAGETEDTLRELLYPDTDIVLQEFTLHCPASIRQSISMANIPPRQMAEPPAANGEDHAPREWIQPDGGDALDPGLLTIL